MRKQRLPKHTAFQIKRSMLWGPQMRMAGASATRDFRQQSASPVRHAGPDPASSMQSRAGPSHIGAGSPRTPPPEQARFCTPDGPGAYPPAGCRIKSGMTMGNMPRKSGHSLRGGGPIDQRSVLTSVLSSSYVRNVGGNFGHTPKAETASKPHPCAAAAFSRASLASAKRMTTSVPSNRISRGTASISCDTTSGGVISAASATMPTIT